MYDYIFDGMYCTANFGMMYGTQGSRDPNLEHLTKGDK